MMVVVTGLTQALFFRQSIIDRESVIVSDMANALAHEHLISASDMANYSNAAAMEHLGEGFGPISQLSGTQRIKVFNRDYTIVWSDNPGMLGTKHTTHIGDLTRAMHGEIRAVFNSEEADTSTGKHDSSTPESIEIYTPIFEATQARPGAAVIGVLSLSRSPLALNQTIRDGLYLLWTVIGLTGLVLFSALYKLFTLVYSRQKLAESRFTKLSADHDHIVQLEKLSAMGEIVSEIAHQINNPLVGVINLAQVAERDPEISEKTRRLLVAIEKSGIECSDFVQRLLRLNQAARSEPQSVEVNDLVQDTIAFFHQTIGKHHTLAFAESDKRLMIVVDPVLIRHALFNFIHNAILAAPDKPVVISLAAEELEGVPGYLLSVTDGGSGFSDDAAKKLFKPFFTTRPGGTGLGLSVAQFIAMKHGGIVRAENLPVGGARFSIWLPSAPKP
ncbi:MAG: HAMP domain-containing sensor histidine kinase [Sulfuritalea sp.]|nr:HAMP domain-containing sensor histidine kinase [Sulfuritalea sp.]